MENKEIALKVVGVVAVVAIMASVGIVFSMVRDIQSMTPRDSSVLDQIVNSVRETDESHASDDLGE